MKWMILTIICGLLACCERGGLSPSEKKEQIGTENPPDVVEKASQSDKLPVETVDVPGKPILPGPKDFSRLNRIMKNTKAGDKLLIRLTWKASSSPDVVFTAPHVSKGWVKIYSNDGVISLMPGRKVVITANDKTQNAVGTPGWGMSFLKEGGNRIGSPCLILENTDPWIETAFRLPVEIEKDTTSLYIRIELSADYEGDKGNWYICRWL